MSAPLTADFSRFLADLSNRMPPEDQAELRMALEDIDVPMDAKPIANPDDERVGEKPRAAILQLISEYMAPEM